MGKYSPKAISGAAWAAGVGGVMCGTIDDVEGRELDRRWRRARKEHRCYACRETIRRGDRYHVATSIEYDDIVTFRHCARCWLMTEALWHAGVEAVEWDLNCGEVWDMPPDDIAALAFLTAEEAQKEIRP